MGEAAIRPGWVRPSRDRLDGAGACPERAGRTASGAGSGPVYRVPLLASLQPDAGHPAPRMARAGSQGNTVTPAGRRRTPREPGPAPLSLELWHSTA